MTAPRHLATGCFCRSLWPRSGGCSAQTRHQECLVAPVETNQPPSLLCLFSLLLLLLCLPPLLSSPPLSLPYFPHPPFFQNVPNFLRYHQQELRNHSHLLPHPLLSRKPLPQYFLLFLLVRLLVYLLVCLLVCPLVRLLALLHDFFLVGAW